ncbi:MAG: sugar ABC transporter ATP-binding protein [Tepidisphaeraceae bacterium]
MFIHFRAITKNFAGVTALDGVTLSIRRGETHALMGENGAGKSTLGKVLAGIYRPDGGELIIGGVERHFSSPADAVKAGIAMVHQELAFCPDLSVAENLSMGFYPQRMKLFVDRRAMRRRATELLARIGVVLDVTQPMRSLSTAQEQLVQIASAVGTGADVLVFDEPTSSLSEPESQQLFALIGQLKARGVTMIYVSHRLPEVLRLCDRISVLRDGKYVGTLDRATATEDEVVRMMIGRSLDSYLPEHGDVAAGEVVLRVRNLASPCKFSGVNFDVRAGEIVGFAGLVGAGRSEIAKAVFGLDKAAAGEMQLDGKPLAMGCVRQTIRRGVGLLPEDRKRQGLVLGMGGRQNFSLAMLDRFKRLGLLDQRGEKRRAANYFDKLRVKTPSLDTPVAGLSGGNQQKVALAKWLGRGSKGLESKLLIVDEPTRGVDVGAKAAIHQLLDQLARQGVAVMLISSELPELLALSSRILVIREGKLVGELAHTEATQDRVLRLMTGIA